MDLPERPPKYNLYEEIVQLGDYRLYRYYVDTVPTNVHDRVIVEDLCVIILNESSIAHIIVKKEHYPPHYERIDDDFDVCSPTWISIDTLAAEKFARKEIGPNWKETHSKMFFEFRYVP
jgi:hypothetical protein